MVSSLIPVVAAAALGAGETWTFIPDLSGVSMDESVDLMSGDGTTVATVWYEMTVWSQDDGLVRFPDLRQVPGSDPWSVVGISADGGRVVFEVHDSQRADFWVWTRGVGFQRVEEVFTSISTEEQVFIRGISADGHSVLGARVEGDAACWGIKGPAMRWSEDGTVEELRVPGFEGAGAERQSRDGSVIAGECFGSNCSVQAWMWTAQDGISVIPPPSGYRGGIIFAVSGDGSTCGGIWLSRGLSAGSPMIWRADTGSRVLGVLPPEYGEFAAGYVTALTSDGAMAFGRFEKDISVFGYYDPHTFIWTEATGLMSAADYVNARIEHPRETDGDYYVEWGVADVLDISDDGRTFLVERGWSENGGPYLNIELALVTITPDGECIGDFTGDGRTDFVDFNIFATNFGEQVPPGTSGDYTGNGVVNLADFSLLMQDFGCGSDP